MSEDDWFVMRQRIRESKVVPSSDYPLRAHQRRHHDLGFSE